MYVLKVNIAKSEPLVTRFMTNQCERVRLKIHCSQMNILHITLRFYMLLKVCPSWWLV